MWNRSTGWGGGLARVRREDDRRTDLGESGLAARVAVYDARGNLVLCEHRERVSCGDAQAEVAAYEANDVDAEAGRHAVVCGSRSQSHATKGKRRHPQLERAWSTSPSASRRCAPRRFRTSRSFLSTTARPMTASGWVRAQRSRGADSSGDPTTAASRRRERRHPGLQAEYVVLLNNDTAAEPGWLEELVRRLTEPDYDFAASLMLLYSRHGLVNAAGDIYPPCTMAGRNRGLGRTRGDDSSPRRVLGACAEPRSTGATCSTRSGCSTRTSSS